MKTSGSLAPYVCLNTKASSRIKKKEKKKEERALALHANIFYKPKTEEQKTVYLCKSRKGKRKRKRNKRKEKKNERRKREI